MFFKLLLVTVIKLAITLESKLYSEFTLPRR